MNLKGIIYNDYNTRARYDYYLSLGYSETASEILSTTTYGNSSMSRFMTQMHFRDTFRDLHSWLLSRSEQTPQDAFENHIREMDEKKRPRHDVAPDGTVLYREKNLRHGVRGLSLFCASDSSSREYYDLDTANSASKRPAIYEFRRARSLPREYAESEIEFCMTPRINTFHSFLEALSTDQYETIEEKQAQNPLFSPTSTFRMTTNTASVGIVLNQIRNNRQVERSQVRIEELLNYFHYQTKTPTARDFEITTEQMKTETNKELLYIHVGAKEETKDGQNIVLLLDVSGSMSGQAEVTQLAVATIVSKLKKGDRISLVTYSNTDSVVLKGYKIRNDSNKEQIMGKLLAIEINGGTYGSKGIETAYQIGEKYYDACSNNQVILITDGDLNFGVTEKGGLIDLIEEKKKSNLFLSVIGTGLYNYKDDKLEALSKHGNGTYCVVNNLEDVRESVNRRYISLTNIIAKDVKAQVEFNPQYVKKYRLLGYENRALSHAEFKDDTVISEPYGSGGYGVALYEITLGDADDSELKYQKPMFTGLDEICTVKVRYKTPLSDSSEEIERIVKSEDTVSDNLKLARFLYCIGALLRNSEMLEEADLLYFRGVVDSGEYKNLALDNQEELELLISAVSQHEEQENSSH